MSRDTQSGGGRPRPSGQDVYLRVNSITCDAHGLCIELLPELITSDPWGYPIIEPGPVPAELRSLATRAVAACPTLALLLVSGPDRKPITPR